METVLLLFMAMYFANVVTFLLFAADKRMSAHGRRRIPVSVLYVAPFLFGAFGALCGMVLFSHETTKTGLKVCVPLFLSMQIAFIVLYRLEVIVL